MSLDDRLNRLESSPPPSRPPGDESVLADIASGEICDRHVEWLDRIMRPAITAQLVSHAIFVRLNPEEAIPEEHMQFAVGSGITILAARYDEPVPDLTQSVLGRPQRSMPWSSSWPGFVQDHPKSVWIRQHWLRAELVHRALGPNRGRDLRAGIDAALDSGQTARLPVDLRCPPPAQLDRHLDFSRALDVPEDLGLVMPGLMWRVVESQYVRRKDIS